MKRALLILLVVLLAAGAYFGSVYRQVSRQAEMDEAESADVIVVLGAAQYYGKPSPVLKARLDHALELYDDGLAQRIIATGGHGPGAKFSEGEVSRLYLSERGVPAEYISIENTGQSTMESAAAVAEIMDRMALESCIVVSDAYHIFRVKQILAERGLTVYGSPRAWSTQDEWIRAKRYARESASYILWRVGIRI